jgi:tRNA(Ile)-lysidine synthase
MDWGLPCTTEVVDVRAVAQKRRLSLEEAARQVRYGFLARLAIQIGATAVAVGHNADDQSETVLMHFLRGAGLAGLRGMSPAVDLGRLRLIEEGFTPSSTTASIKLVRPLLSIPRAAIERYCRLHNLPPRFDRSNLDTTLFRNRLRHQLLPLLETYNPNTRALLRRTAALAAADYELLSAVRDEAWERLVREESGCTISFDLRGWRALPLALQRTILRTATGRLRPELRDVNFIHIEQAVTIATSGSTGAQAILPQGLRLTVDYQTLRLSGTEDVPPTPDWPLLWQGEPLPVVMPGQTALPDSQWQLETQRWNGRRDAALSNPDRWTAYLDAEQLGPNPTLRTRQPGDRFQPLGMGGRHVDVADFMVNAKIPRCWRGHIPVLVHDRPAGHPEEQEIAWLIGWRIDERVKITDGTRHIICLRWHRRSLE